LTYSQMFWESTESNDGETMATDSIARRGVLKMGAAAFAAGSLATALEACSGSSAASNKGLTPVKFALSWIPGIEWGGTYIAQERDYYRDEGVDLTVLPGGPNVAVEPLIATNKIDVGMTYGLGTATTDINGGSIKIFGTQYQRSPDVILSLANKPIRSLGDLTGKTIGIPSDTILVWHQFLLRNHIPSAAVHVAPVQSSLDPLVNGQVDGIVTYSTETAQLVAQGMTPVFLYMADYNYNDISNGYGASTTTLANDREKLIKFMRAEIRGWQDFVADPEYAARLTVTKYARGAGLTLKETIIEAEQTAALVTYGPVAKAKGLMWLSPGLEQTVLSVVNASLKTPVTTAQIFDDTLLADVYQGRNRVT
jgi:ABC-type nitrate/sulfonate/bicarbonate transport system substrate-binding protein